MIQLNPFGLLGRYIQDCKKALEKHYFNDEEMKMRLREIDNNYLGTIEKDGFIQDEMNRKYRDILINLKLDHPRFTRKRILVFSLLAAGIPYDVIRQQARIPHMGALYTMKSLIAHDIANENRPRKSEYLALLRHE